MHEGAIAQSIVSTILEVAAREKARRILRLELEIGEICLVNAEQLGYLINLFSRDTIAQDLKLTVEETKTRIRCQSCSYLGAVEYRDVDPAWHYRLPDFACVKCGSNQTEIVQGKELVIKNIDVTF